MGDRLAQVVRIDAGARDGFNEPTPTEVVEGRVYVRQVELSDAEHREAGAQAGLSVSAFVMRRNALTAAIGVDHVLRIGGRDWQVTGAHELLAQRRGRVRVTAKVRSDG